MSFGDAVRSVLTQYTGFSGRARRSEYWYFFLFNILVSVVFGIIDAIIAWYTSAATVGNSMAKRIIAPVGGPLWRDNVAVRA